MQQINSDFFIQENNTVRILNNITKYCSKCYKELSAQDNLFLNTKTYEYICDECACCLSQELKTHTECIILECQEESLF